MGFKNNLKIEFVGVYKGVLLEDLIYTSDDINITVKKGFKTDGASIPKWLWSIVGSPFTGKYREASVLHDNVYKYRLLTKKESDLLFYRIMLESGVNKLKAKLFYLILTIFGNKKYPK